MKNTIQKTIVLMAVLTFVASAYSTKMPQDKEFTNSIGMEAVSICLGEKEYYEFICCDMGLSAEGRLSQ